MKVVIFGFMLFCALIFISIFSLIKVVRFEESVKNGANLEILDFSAAECFELYCREWVNRCLPDFLLAGAIMLLYPVEPEKFAKIPVIVISLLIVMWNYKR